MDTFLKNQLLEFGVVFFPRLAPPWVLYGSFMFMQKVRVFEGETHCIVKRRRTNWRSRRRRAKT